MPHAESPRRLPVRRRAPALVGALVLAFTAGCHDHSALEKQLAELRQELRQIKTVESNTSVLLEDVENRVLLLQDQVDSTRLLVGAGNLAPAAPLPVVRLGAPAPDPRGADLYGTAGRDPSPGDLGAALPEPAALQAAPAEGAEQRAPWRGTGGDVPDPMPARQTERDPFGGTIEYQELGPEGQVLAGPPPLEPPPATPAAPAPAEAGAGRRTFDSRPLMLYKQGMDLLNEKRHREAVAVFEDFLVQFPNHDYADNCLYWVGEAYYDRQMYQQALEHFEQVAVQYPRGNKVPDALLKAAYSYRALGMRDRAMELLDRVVRAYPGTSAAQLAEKSRAGLL